MKSVRFTLPWVVVFATYFPEVFSNCLWDTSYAPTSYHMLTHGLHLTRMYLLAVSELSCEKLTRRTSNCTCNLKPSLKRRNQENRRLHASFEARHRNLSRTANRTSRLPHRHSNPGSAAPTTKTICFDSFELRHAKFGAEIHSEAHSFELRHAKFGAEITAKLNSLDQENRLLHLF